MFMKTLTAATKKLATSLVLEQQVALDIEDMSNLTPEQQRVLEIQVKQKIGTLRAKNVVRTHDNAVFNPEFFQKPPTTETQNHSEQTANTTAPQSNVNPTTEKIDSLDSRSSSAEESGESSSAESDSDEEFLFPTPSVLPEENEKCSIPNEVEDLMNQVVSGNVMGLNDFLSNMCNMQRPVRHASSKNLLLRLSQDSNNV
eukprot:TRINITY_DN241_c0_g3_i1.p1 TRINITY_DN241_c0_g3~~TRINITY_DN241_c0_g3_i1.p1  ORF type:complete len:200 (-),score=27.65 TRINITY_DN241_c0_g3_i1:75-674(-)